MDELSKRYFGLIMDKIKKENEYEKYLKEIIYGNNGNNTNED